MTDAARPTPDPGWDVRVRHTLAVPLESTWTFLLGEGLPLWLGRTALVLEKGAPFETDDDIRGRVLSFTPGVQLRLTWQPGEWDHDSTLQLSAKQASGGTTIGFHHERLSGREERKIMLGHWKEVVLDIESALSR